MSPGPNSGPQPTYSRGNSGGHYDNFHNHHHQNNPNHLNTHNTNNPHPRRYHHQ